MRFIVTGSAGYVGSVLCPRLRAAGHEVRGIDVGLYRDSALYQASGQAVPTLGRDVRDVLPGDFANADALVHLAGLSNDPLGELDPVLTEAINVDGGLRCLAAAREAGVRRAVVASSCSVYGAAGDDWIDEEAAPAPLTAYARSKLALERGALALARPGFEVVVARPGTVYGVAPMLRFDLVLNNLVAWTLASGRLRFKSDGSAWRPLLHVADLADALIALATLPASAVAARAFNVVFDAGNHRVRALADPITRALPGRPPEWSAEGGADTRSYRVSGARLAALWSPPNGPIGLDAGIAELVAQLARTPVDAEAIEGPRFQRVAHLRAQLESGALDRSLRRRG